MAAETTIPSSGERGAAPAPVLFLDLEGGFGGSSRSMYYLVRHMDREAFVPVVVVRKAGPIVARYEELGVACRVMPGLPSFRPGERKQAVAYAMYLASLRRLSGLAGELADLARERGVRLLHVNHESLALTGARLADRLGLPWVCHIRTTLIPSRLARYVYGVVNRRAQGVVFITDQNMTHFAALVGKGFARDKALVARNIAPTFPSRPGVRDASAPFEVVSLSNFSPNRGVDRVVDVALELKRRGRRDFRFPLYGQAAHRRLLGRGAGYLEGLVSRVQAEGLSDMVVFPGHTDDPEGVLLRADALIKLTREANPWGRDIMEGLAAGVPVVTLGAYEGFVEHGVNGYLELGWDPVRVADFLVRLKDEPGLWQTMSEANRARAARLFNGPANAAMVERLYAAVLAGWRARA